MAWTALLRSRLGRWAVAGAETDVDAVDYTGRQCGQGRPQEEQRDCHEYLPEGAGVAEDVAQQALRQHGGERGGANHPSATWTGSRRQTATSAGRTAIPARTFRPVDRRNALKAWQLATSRAFFRRSKSRLAVVLAASFSMERNRQSTVAEETGKPVTPA